MRWNLGAEAHEHYDSRLDDFRGRVGKLTHSSGEPFAMVVLDRLESQTLLGGHLWWRKWSEPAEMFLGHMFFADGQYTDWVSASQEDVLRDLTDWQRGDFVYDDTTYRVDWLDETASARAREVLLASSQ